MRRPRADGCVTQVPQPTSGRKLHPNFIPRPVLLLLFCLRGDCIWCKPPKEAGHTPGHTPDHAGLGNFGNPRGISYSLFYRYNDGGIAMYIFFPFPFCLCRSQEPGSSKQETGSKHSVSIRLRQADGGGSWLLRPAGLVAAPLSTG